MQIRRLFMVETGSYEDMMLRPYDTSNMNTKHLLQLQEVTQGGRNLAAPTLAGIAGQIVRPASQPQGMAQIPNGWGERRLRFLMEVVEPDGFGGEQVQYLTGFTNYVGVVNNFSQMHLDPNMELYFNTSITTRRVPYQTPMGLSMEQRITDASHILTGHYNPSPGHLNHTTHTMRPQDVFDAVGASTLTQFGADVIDTRTTFASSKLKKSIRANTSAPTYLSRLLTTHQNVMMGADTSDDLGKIMAEASGVVREPGITTDPFLNELILRTKLAHGGSITYGELCRLQPGLDDIVHVVLATGINAAHNHQRGLAEGWQGNTHETIMANILIHAVPALMMDLMITKVGFTATNRTQDGQTEVLLTGVRTFTENVDMEPYLNRFIMRLKAEVLNDLSMNGLIDYYIQATFDAMGETVIDISVGGQPSIRYVSPSFADALFVPVVTNDQFVLNKLANDISTLAENLQVDHSPARTFGYHDLTPPTAGIHSFGGFNGTSGAL